MSRITIIAAALASALTAACGPYNQGVAPASRGLEPVNQPVVSRTDYVLDLAGGYEGLGAGEAERLDAWLGSLDARYGDTLFVDASSNAGSRAGVEAVASRYGLPVDPGAPVTAGRVPEGATRVILSRKEAYVPGCPNWDGGDDVDLSNAQSSGYGCTVNGNLAAMIADPEDLLRGRDAGALSDTRIITRAVKAYRDAAPSGAGGTIK